MFLELFTFSGYFFVNHILHVWWGKRLVENVFFLILYKT